MRAQKPEASTERAQWGCSDPKGTVGRSWSQGGDPVPRSQRAKGPGNIVLCDTEQSRGKAGNESQLLPYSVC